MDDDAIPINTMGTSESGELGIRGEQEVEVFFQRNHFGATRFESPDLGVDLRIEVKQRNPVASKYDDLGYMLGCQVKTGNSYFAQETTQQYHGEATRGAWFSCDEKHRTYWTTSNTRIFLIMQRGGPDNGPSNDERYWQWLDDADLYIHTGRDKDGNDWYKVFVPYCNKVDDSFCSFLIECAHDYRRKQLLATATTFTFNISQYKTSQYARYALLLPDLVAPHPNRGLDRPITWPEALALVAQHDPGRWINAFYSSATKFDDVPTLTEAAASTDPGWRFTAACYSALFKNDVSELESLPDLPSSLAAARTVLFTAWAYDRQEYERVLSTIDDAISHIADLSAIDEAWLLIHKGNALCELARWDEARDAFRKSKSLITDPASDLTAKRILDITSIALFDIEPPTKKGLEALTTARDDELARFSLRREAIALDATFKELFKNWAEPNGITVGASDTLVIKCQIARETSLLAGDIPAYREALSKLAIIPLAIRGESDVASMRDSLSRLMRAGDGDRLKQALLRVRETANPDITSSFMNGIDPHSMTPIMTPTCLDALAVAGDYLDATRANEWYEVLLGAIRDSEQFARRYETPNGFHSWKMKATECLSSMRFQLSAQQLDDIAAAIVDNPAGLEAARVPVRNLLECAAEEARLLPHLHELATDEHLPGWLARIFNDVLGPGDATQSREALHNEFTAGDASHLHLIGRFDALEPDEADALLGGALRELEAIVQESDAGVYSHRMTDYGYLAANLLLRADDASGWTRLVAFMEHPLVNNREKLSAARVIIDGIDHVPAEATDLMLAHEDAIASSLMHGQIMLQDAKEENEIINAMFLAFHGKHDGFDDAFAASFANGDTINRYSVSLLGHASHPEAMLLELCSSSSRKLAVRAFWTFARLCCDDAERCHKYADMLQDWSLNHGGGFAAGLISAASDADALPPGMITVLERLAKDHPSSAIRYQARKCLEGRDAK